MYNNKETFEFIGGLLARQTRWKTIAEILNARLGLSHDESTYRKRYKKYTSNLPDPRDEVYEKYNIDYKDIEKKKHSIKRGAKNEIIRDVALRDLYYEDMKEAIKNLPQFNFDFKNGSVPTYKSKNEYFIVITDLHYDGNFCLKQILGYLVDQIADFCKRTSDITRLNIIELGDCIEGSSLRPSQMRAIKLGMIDQILETSEAYASMLVELQNRTNLPISFYMLTESNHTQIRPLNTKRNELPDEDLLKVMASFLELRVGMMTNIDIISDDDLFMLFENMNIVASHGHKYNVTPARFVDVAKELKSFYRKKFGANINKPTYYIFGHWHQYRECLIEEFEDAKDKAFLVPALSPIKSSYERVGLMGTNPAFTIFKFDDNGNHVYTQTINTMSINE